MTEYRQFTHKAAASIFAELSSHITDPFQLRAKSEDAWRRAHLLAAQFEDLEMDDRDARHRLHAAAATFLDFYSTQFAYELDALDGDLVIRTVSPVKGQGGLVVVETSLLEAAPFVVCERLAHYLRRLQKQPEELLQGIHVKLVVAADTSKTFWRISELLAEDRMPELHAFLGLPCTLDKPASGKAS